LQSVKSTAGFGGCAVVSQLSSSGSTDSTPSGSAGASAPVATTGSSSGKVPCKKTRRRAVGTRAPRAMRRAESLHENPVFL
jgi:hypothetical protein